MKPAPPPKPASLIPAHDGRMYRELQLTPEMYNQLRGLQKKAKDLRTEVRNLRRMSQAQAHSVKETIRDTFIKIRAMLMAGGEQAWQSGKYMTTSVSYFPVLHRIYTNICPMCSSINRRFQYFNKQSGSMFITYINV